MDPTKLQIIAEDVAKKVGKVIFDKFTQKRTIEKKGRIDLVTDADLAANEVVVNELARRTPDAAIMAEEDQVDFKQTLARASDLIWIADPIDGTTNYAKKIPHSAVSIACFSKSLNQILAGVVFDPWRNECFTAAVGSGAFLNGQKISVSNTKKLDQSLLATGFAYDIATNPDDNLAEFSVLIKKTLGIRRFGVASLDLAWVAMGRFDGYFERNLKPWDIAAGMLLVSEAGGVVANYQGDTLDLFLGHILACNKSLLPTLSKTILSARSRAGLPALPLF